MAKSAVASFLDEDINTFLDEGQEAPKGLGAGGYLDASYQSLKRGITPKSGPLTGHADSTLKTLQAIELDKSRRTGQPSSLDTSPGLQSLLGIGDAALTLGHSMYSGVETQGAGLLKSLFGLVPDAEKEADRLYQLNARQPKTEAGQRILEGVSPFINEVLIPMGAHQMGMPKGEANLARLKTLEKQKGFMPFSNVKANLDAAIPKPVAPTAVEAPLTGGAGAFDNIRKSQGAPKTVEEMFLESPAIDAMVKDITGKEAREAAFAASERQSAAQRAIDERQAALEFEVKKKALQDFNAAERARQEQAPTGYQDWVEQQRAMAEQRQPGDNTPVNFENVNPADINPLQDTPYQYRGAIEFDQPMMDKSLPVEIADTLNNTPSPDPFNRYSPQQAARRILIEGEHPPIIKTNPNINKFGQGGGIMMDMLLPKKLVDMLEKWRAAGGRTLIPDIHRMIDDAGNPPLSEDARQILLTKYKDDDITHRYLARIDRATENNDFARAQREYKRLDSHLMSSIVNDEFQGYKNYNAEQEPYMAKTGLYGERDQAKLAAQNLIRKFGQGGAIDPRLIEDLYKFGKSVVRGADKQLLPVYHGTTKEINGLFKTVKGFKDYRNSQPRIENDWIIPADRAYPGDLGTWFSSTPKGTDTFAGARTGVPGGNVHQAYLNLTQPKVFETHGDFIDWFHEKAADGRSANSIRRSLIKDGFDGIQIKDSMTDAGGARQDFVAFHPQQIESAISPTGISNRSQRGAIDPDLLTLGIPKLISGIKSVVTKSPQRDSLQTPNSPETISRKADLRAKATAAKIDVYQPITTVKEAIDPANLGKDIGPLTQEAGAGVGGAVRRNPTNGPLKFARFAVNEYTGARDAYLKKYITGKDGFNDTYKKLSPQEKADVYEFKKWLSENQVDYTPEMADKAGLSDTAKKHMEVRAKAYADMEAVWGEMNLEKGLETFPHRMGYMASIFDRNYQALVGKMVNGAFKMEGMIGAKSLKEFNDALKHYEGKQVIRLGQNGRTGLRTQTTTRMRMMDDMAFLLNAMAEHDPKYADVKGALASAKAAQNKGYMNFDVHELNKKGVSGYQGGKPWVGKATNMKEQLEAEIQYFDQAANYVYGQKFLDQMAEMQTEIRDKLPRTAQYLDKYVNNITGKNIEPTAAAVNQIADAVTKLAGKTSNLLGVKMPENPYGALRGVGTVMNAMLMNIVNAGMFSAQMLQLPIAGMTESARIRSQYGMPASDIVSSMGRSYYLRGMMPLLDSMGKLDQSNIPSHMKDAWHWMKEHGMDDFNEVMLSQDILQSNAMSKTKQVAFWPTVVPEKITRPAMFLWMTDMFHRAGFDNKQAIQRAKYATDYSMTDYRHEEAPLMYNRMGILNPETSALQRYKHNALDQVVSRLKDSKEHQAALLMSTALAVSFGGLLGLPGMSELDQMIVQPITGKSAREHLENALGADNRVADGLASAYTGLDMASRFSLADVAPNSFGEAVAGARLSKLFKMGVAAYEAGKNQDEASLLALGQELVPSGLGQAYRETMLTDENKNLLNKKGQRMFDQPREGGLSAAAIMGARPLEEKRVSELNYARNKRLTDIQKKAKDARDRMEMAINFGNKEDFRKHLEKYKENQGDMNSIGSIIEKAKVQGMMTETQRMQGTPGNTPMSIKRFLEFQD